MRSFTRISLFALIVIGLYSCRGKEEDAVTPDRDYSAALDNFQGEFFFADALRLSDIAYKDGEDGSPCIQSITIDLDTMPHSMLIDLGNTNCTGENGLSRRGQLFVTFDGAYGDPGTEITITPQNYFVNDHQVQGVKTVTNAGQNDQGQTFFNVNVNGTVTAPDGSWTSSHNSQRIRTWIEGEGTTTVFDDVYLISGNGSGVNRNGQAYTTNTVSPLRVEIGCPWIVSGVQQVIPSGLSARSIDFGSGACDPIVSITVGDYTFSFGG